MKNEETVLVALSGGMDSAAAVLLLRDEMGFRRIEGLYLDMSGNAEERLKAEETAGRLRIPLHVEPVADRFQQEVIGYVLREHERGFTPGPCSRCNPEVKWRVLGEVADRFGIHYIATGHYVQTVLRSDGFTYFLRGVDPAKDQSYYLWDVPQELFKRAVMPLGKYTKAKVREMLKEKYSLSEVAERRESMGVCFSQGRYMDFLKENLTLEAGEVVDEDNGMVLGSHEGAALYTTGQKRGFALLSEYEGRGYAVVRIDTKLNRLYVSRNPERLYIRTIVLRDWQVTNWDELLAKAETDLSVMIRGLGWNPEKAGCRIQLLQDGDLHLELLHDKAWAVCPGQPCALYLDNNHRLVGGGIIR